MRKLVCLVVTCLAVAGCSKKPTAVADLVIRHVNIHTMDDKNPRATALAVQGDKILWLGDDKDAGNISAKGPAWSMPAGGCSYLDLSTATFI